jgi:PII-like signaling protein
MVWNSIGQPMSLAGEQVLLRVYLQSADRAPHVPTYERLVKAARSAGLAGATVLRGIIGLGSRGLIPSSIWSLVQHVPVIVEFVDSPQRIIDFLPLLEQHMVGGMATLERAHVVMYRHRKDELGEPFQLAGIVPPRSTLPKIPLTATRMQTNNEDGVLLRVFLGESDRFGGKPLYEAIVQKVRELGLAGATVLRGSEGFGANSVVHKAALLEMSTDLPIVVEVVDRHEQIQRLLPSLQEMVHEGMITMEYVAILMCKPGEAK